MNRKPFYKQVWFIVLMIFVLGAIVTYIKDAIHNTPKKFEWYSVEASDKLPKPKSKMGVININKENNLSMSVDKMSKTDFEEYVNECIEMGYEEGGLLRTDIHFSGQDKNGYSLGLSYDEKNNRMYIQLLRRTDKK